MNLRTITRLSGVLGGLCWVVRMVVVLAGPDEGPLLETLRWVGLALLALAIAGYGAGLVSRSVAWLRLIVAVAFPVLVWSVLEVLHPAGDPAVVDGLFGAAVLVLSGLLLGRDRDRDRNRERNRGGGRGERTARQPRRARGAHAR